MSVKIIVGDCKAVLQTLLAGSVHTVVTSPPYFGLRNYGVDGQLGLEATPQEYVATMVDVFREVRRVLRADGSLWLNMGDSYANDGKWGGHTGGKHIKALHGGSSIGRNKRYTGLKPKDLIGIPWRIAFALQEPYYTGPVKNICDRVWLAAMLDAEGTICGTEYKFNEHIKTNLYICITNTSEPVIEKCETIFPQEVKHVYEKTNGNSGRKCLRWDVERISGKALFIRTIYPHLVAKRKQAIIGYTFVEMQRGLASKKKGYLVDQREQRTWLMSALSLLNSGKNVDLPNWLIEPPSLFEPGFYLRQDIIWSKPNPMPESVTDRCTKSHEYIFLLSKSARYFYDAEAIKEPVTGNAHSRGDGINPKCTSPGQGIKQNASFSAAVNGLVQSRNRRSVWEIATAPFVEAHFATFPPALVEPCIKAGTSEKGCCAECWAPWVRQLERGQLAPAAGREKSTHGAKGNSNLDNVWSDDNWKPGHSYEYKTIGWSPSCKCDGAIVPCTVLDPFGGAGTTGLVADRLQRDAILIELNPKYASMAERRIAGDSPLFSQMAAE
jgi:DNA modification methylase